MSETVHYKGKLERLYSGTLPLEVQLQMELEKVGSEFTVCDYLANYEEALEELQEIDDYFLYKNNLYSVSREKQNPYDDIMSAHKIDEYTIEFELRYYNGGCCFQEALETALEGMV
jgi:hypothetical protein